MSPISAAWLRKQVWNAREISIAAMHLLHSGIDGRSGGLFLLPAPVGHDLVGHEIPEGSDAL